MTIAFRRAIELPRLRQARVSRASGRGGGSDRRVLATDIRGWTTLGIRLRKRPGFRIAPNGPGPSWGGGSAPLYLLRREKPSVGGLERLGTFGSGRLRASCRERPVRERADRPSCQSAGTKPCCFAAASRVPRDRCRRDVTQSSVFIPDGFAPVALLRRGWVEPEGRSRSVPKGCEADFPPSLPLAKGPTRRLLCSTYVPICQDRSRSGWCGLGAGGPVRLVDRRTVTPA